MSSTHRHVPPDEIASPFTAVFIKETAQAFKLDPTALEAALAEAMIEYNIAAPYAERLKSWRGARVRLADTHRHLEKALASWRKGKGATWQTFTEFSFGEYTAEDFATHLQKLVDELEEILDFARLTRGNPGHSDDDHAIDLNAFRGVVAVLDELWVNQKYRHLGHGFLEEFEGKDDADARNNKLGDAGLLFAWTCLRQLDKRVTRKHTSSLIRWLKQK